jgi:DNA-binding response OmpR family regulator
MREHQPTTTVAIVDANTVVESALAQLLEGEGYSIRLLKSSTTGVVEEQLDGVDLVVLSPGLTSGACEALLGALRSTPERSTANPHIRVIALCTPMREAPLDGEAVRSVPWPIPFERLVGEIEAMLAVRLPPGDT